MAIPVHPSHTLGTAAKLRLAASSLATVASGYERSLRRCGACFSRPESAICADGDRS
jgi:hypothetical protein